MVEMKEEVGEDEKRREISGREREREEKDESVNVAEVNADEATT